MSKAKPKNETIQLTSTQRGGAYADVIAAAHKLAGEYGSAANALAAMVRESPKFRLGQLRGTPEP